MRSPVLKAFSLGMITGSFATAGMILLATPAKADTTDPAAYADKYGTALCATIDQTIGQYSNDDIFMGIGQAVMQDGFSAYQAGQILYWSVEQYCPQHLDRVLSFAADVEMVA
jgi:hypothetical protein